MTEIEEWLEGHHEDLEAIARATGTSVDLVHVAAVLARGGAADKRILEECEALRPRLGPEAFRPKGLERALPLIRNLFGQTAETSRPQ
jgi:hypothetical protein